MVLIWPNMSTLQLNPAVAAACSDGTKNTRLVFDEYGPGLIVVSDGVTRAETLSNGISIYVDTKLWKPKPEMINHRVGSFGGVIFYAAPRFIIENNEKAILAWLPKWFTPRRRSVTLHNTVQHYKCVCIPERVQAPSPVSKKKKVKS